MHYLIKECPQNLKDLSNIDATSRQRQNRKYIYIKPSYFYIGLRFLKRNHKPQYYPMYPQYFISLPPCTPILPSLTSIFHHVSQYISITKAMN